MAKLFFSFTCLLVILSTFCSCTYTHKVAYPPSDDLFITMGDDPGSESQKSYIPKGTFIHFSQEWYFPIPLLGLVTLGNAEPQYVFDNEVIPKIKEMGGDALTNATVKYEPPPHILARLIGFPLILYTPSSTLVVGQVVKK